MKTIEIFGDNRHDTYTKTRDASRGIVIEDGRILLTYEVHTDQWFLPGGGREAGESLEACCIRELAEETGYLVSVERYVLTVKEYYEDWLYTSEYFVCRRTGETERHLTIREREVGLEPRWIPLKEALEIFSKHQSYASDEMKRGSYLREYRALQGFLEEGAPGLV